MLGPAGGRNGYELYTGGKIIFDSKRMFHPREFCILNKLVSCLFMYEQIKKNPLFIIFLVFFLTLLVYSYDLNLYSPLWLISEDLPWVLGPWFDLGAREYLMIYRGPGYLAVEWFGSSQTPSPPFDRRHTGRLRKREQLTDGRRGWVRS